MHRLFGINFGILPREAPLTTVIGKPLDVPKIAEPSHAQVEHYHSLYMEELVRLFDKYKDIYAKDRKSDLRIVQ